MRSSTRWTGAGVLVASIAAGVSCTGRAEPQPPFRAEASVQQLMRTVLDPAADALWGAVGTVVTAEGVEEWAPKTDEEWLAVEHGAAVLIESTNLLMIGDRLRDNEDWVRMSQALADAATISLRAAEARDVEGVFNSGEAVFRACETCHMQYWIQ